MRPESGQELTFYNSINKKEFKFEKQNIPIYDFGYYNDTLICSNLNYVYYSDDKLTVKKRDNLIGSENHRTHRAFLALQNGEFLGATHIIRKYERSADQSILVSNELDKFKQVFDLFEDSKNDIWVASMNGLFQIQNYDFKEIQKSKDENKYLDQRINEIHEYKDAGLLMSSHSHGILYKDHRSGHTYKLDKSNGLSSNIVNRVFIENDSTIWAATNNGLNKIVVGPGKIFFNNVKSISLLSTINGLNSNYIYDIAKHGDNIWVATQNGINYFNPDHVKITNFEPVLEFDSIVVNRENIVSNNRHTLEHDENDLTFYYTGYSHKKLKDKLFYNYALVKNNTDTVWIETDNRNIQFTNLPHGIYNFLVRALNSKGEWSSKSADFPFVIKKHYTNTLWFKFGVILIVGFIGYWLYRMRENTILQREKQKQLVSEAETRAKQSELNALRNQMNPHFIYNSLNSIQNYIFEGDPKSANYYLSKFSRLIRQSLELSKLENITIKEEQTFLHNYLELEKMRFEEKFIYEINNDSHIDPEYKMPSLLIQPIIENAIKHGFKDITYQGKLKIDFRLQNETLEISVIDNGVGIIKSSSKSNHKSLSYNIIQDRIDILNSTLQNPIAEIKILNNTDATTTGTHVLIVLPIIK